MWATAGQVGYNSTGTQAACCVDGPPPPPLPPIFHTHTYCTTGCIALPSHPNPWGGGWKQKLEEGGEAQAPLLFCSRCEMEEWWLMGAQGLIFNPARGHQLDSLM